MAEQDTVLPTFIAGWDSKALKASLTFGVPDQKTLGAPQTLLERRYALRAVKQRLHQASFRGPESPLTMVGARCRACPSRCCSMPPTSSQTGRSWLGQPVIPNGIPLSKIHHAAFDAHLIGIDPDYRLHVSNRLLEQTDGPMLEALKRLKGGTIHLPARVRDHPDRDRLALRFERFKAVA